MEFPIAIHKDPTSTFGVTIPDLPGCYSAGETIEDAVCNAHEAIICHLQALLSRQERLTLASTPIATLATQPEFADAIWALAGVDISVLKVKRRR
nr:type II toxin-antitoxin system HicB family antitoxin [uncultured Cupriavidus sp.]